MSTHTITRSTSVNQVDTLGTVGDPFALPAGVPEAGLAGSKSWTPGAVTAGASVSTTATITGVKAGDKVSLFISPALPAKCTAQASVTADDTVTILIQNQSAGPVTPGVLTVTIHVSPQGQVVRSDGAE